MRKVLIIAIALNGAAATTTFAQTEKSARALAVKATDTKGIEELLRAFTKAQQSNKMARIDSLGETIASSIKVAEKAGRGSDMVSALQTAANGMDGPIYSKAFDMILHMYNAADRVGTRSVALRALSSIGEKSKAVNVWKNVLVTTDAEHQTPRITALQLLCTFGGAAGRSEIIAMNNANKVADPDAIQLMRVMIRSDFQLGGCSGT